MKLADIPELRDASVSAKLELVEELWAEITAKSATLPLPDWHVREIDRGLAEYEANPREGKPWPEIRDRLLGKQP
jgi:putative addiction module component (TIGR02574 family)